MVKGYGNLPLVFEPNRGQTISQARFLARASGYDVFITADKAILTMGAAPVSMRLVGARSTAKPEAIAPLESYSNYILGNDPARWLQGVPHFAKIRVRGVLPGIDLTYYGERRKLEYDLDVAPRADTRSLKVEFTGADGLSLDADGNLLVHTKAGDIVQHKPWAWQGSKQIKAYYALLRDGAVAIRLGSYNHEQALKIDPVLSYSTYLSGSEGDGATAIAVDSGGYAYVTGITSSLDFPVTAGAFHSGPYGNAFPDIFVSKLTPSGGALVYSTFVGGSYSDQSNAIAIDPLGYVYVTGTSNSGDFPQVPGPSVYPGIPIIIVFKLDPTGVPVYSEFLGGGTALPDANDNDSGRGIAADANGNAYIVGSAGLNFTTTPGAFQPTRPTPNFTTTAFAAKLNASGGLVYSTYLTGTSGISLASAVAVDPTGNAYIVGSTSQATFPVTQGAVGTTYRGGTDAFAVKLNPSGSGLLYGTFLGGTGSDSATSVAIDSSGNAYVTGTTSSTNFPTTTGTIAPTRSGLNSNQTGFVSKLNASGSALTYSTYLGGSNTCLLYTSPSPRD